MGLESWPEVEKCGTITTHASWSRELGNPCLQSLKWVSESWFYICKPVILLLRTHNPNSVLVKLGPGTWPEVEKKLPKNYTSSLAITTMVYNSQMGIQIWFHMLEMDIFSFQPIIPFRTKLGTLERDPKLRKWAQELHVFARNQDHSVQLSNGYPNIDFIFGNDRILLFNP